MKQTFEEPKIEVIDFTVNDVIATSGNGTQGGDYGSIGGPTRFDVVPDNFN